MSLSKLSESIIQKSEKKAHEIIVEARHHIENAKQKEHEKVDEKKIKVNKEIKKTIEQYKKEKMLWAHLEGKRIIAEAKNEVVELSLNRFKEILRQTRKTSEYKSFVRHAVPKAIGELSSIKTKKRTNFIVHVLKGETKLVPKIKGLSIKDDLPEDTLGGVIVEFGDGSVRVNMTLLELLNIKSTEIRGKLYTHLFGKAQRSK